MQHPRRFEELVSSYLAGPARRLGVAIVVDVHDRRERAQPAEEEAVQDRGARAEVALRRQITPQVGDRAAAIEAAPGGRVGEEALEVDQVELGAIGSGEHHAVLAAVRAIGGREIEPVEQLDREVGPQARFRVELLRAVGRPVSQRKAMERWTDPVVLVVAMLAVGHARLAQLGVPQLREQPRAREPGDPLCAAS